MRAKKQSLCPSLTSAAPIVNPVPTVLRQWCTANRGLKKRCDSPSLQKEKEKCGKIKWSRLFLFCMSFIGQLIVTV